MQMNQTNNNLGGDVNNALLSELKNLPTVEFEQADYFLATKDGKLVKVVIATADCGSVKE